MDPNGTQKFNHSPNDQMDWDDFKFLSAVVCHGTVRAAAKALRVHPSTVTRRLEHLETRLGVKLFSRRGQSLVLTAAGETAAAGLRRVEQDIAGIERLLLHSEAELAGPVRVVVPDFLLFGGLADEFDRFVNAYGNVRVEWMSPGSAAAPFDVALEPTAAPALDLIGREVGPVGWSLYGRQGLRTGSAAALKWIEAHGLACEEASARAIDQLRSSHSGARSIGTRCQGIAQLLPLLRAGAGVSALPCLVGDADAELERLPGAGVERVPLWLLRVPESRSTRRVQVLVDYLQAAVRAKAARIRGV